MLIYKLIDPLPLSLSRVEKSPFGHRLIGAGRVDFKSSPAVKPAISTTKPGPLRVDHTDMVRSEGLAKGAAIECVHSFIGETSYSNISFPVDSAGLLQKLTHFVLFSIKGYLNLVHDGAELVMEIGMEDVSDMLQAESLLIRRFA